MSSLDDRQRARLLSIDTLIAWAKTKDPNEHYYYGDVRGGCFFSQYLNAQGVPDHLNSFNPNEVELWYELHRRYKHCVKPNLDNDNPYSEFSEFWGHGTTFGRALRKLKEVV